jgi:hypothetical protein
MPSCTSGFNPPLRKILVAPFQNQFVASYDRVFALAAQGFHCMKAPIGRKSFNFGISGYLHQKTTFVKSPKLTWIAGESGVSFPH